MLHLSMGTHTGTHIDAPLHFIDGGQGIDSVPLDRFIGPAHVIECTGDRIDDSFLRHVNLSHADKVLFKTSNSAFLHNGEFQKQFVHLTEDGASYLVQHQIDLVGIDYLSIERFGTPDHAVHKILLGNDICILEGINLEEVAAGVYYLIALPLRITAGDGSPVRAVLLECSPFDGLRGGEPSSVLDELVIDEV
jgi:arylformamidase